MLTTVVLSLAGLSVMGIALAVASYFPLWLRAYVSGADIPLISLILMSLRKIDPRVIVRARIMAVRAGLLGVSTKAIEVQYLAGGNVDRVVLALIAADRARVELDWDTASAIDLAGRDILEAVQVSVYPKVIFCPLPAAEGIAALSGVAKDGIQLNVRALVTVRSNLAQLVGGATEATVIARVGQGIVSSVGACESYRNALSDPALISRRVNAKDLDAQTAFSIVSIDIASIEVGDNIGAQLQFQQADADIRVARASAEKRRAMAVARQMEMVALTREYEAKVVHAEAEIPVAMATAFRAGWMRSDPAVRSRGTSSLAHPETNGSKFTVSGGRTFHSRRPDGVDDWETDGGACSRLARSQS